MQSQIPLTRDVVLIGGGHSHALVLRKWGMRSMPGARLTLINPGPTAPYTGMLPGHIAGHYQRDALEIDLVKLARFAGARLILGKATGLDAKTHQIEVEGHGTVAYDIGSIDIGITSDLPNLEGFGAFGVPAKPLDNYAVRWRDFLNEAQVNGHAGPICVIGGGIAGVELAMAMSHALKETVGRADVTVIEAAETLTGTSDRSRKALEAALKECGVNIRNKTEISKISATEIHLRSGEVLPTALTIGAAGATPHDWLSQTDLPLTNGYITVNETLQVQGVDGLFATGDCAHMPHAPRPKAGVFAVRAAPVLFANMEASLTGKKLHSFKPQKHYLKLISLGEKSALAEKWGLPFTGPLLWKWKDRIDRAFMAKFQDLPQMTPDAAPSIAADGVAAELASGKPICAGCGSKVGPGALSAALSDLKQPRHPDVQQGAGDDAAVLHMGAVNQVISTDHLRAFTQDHALLARIAAVHALGDIWSMGATPQVALAQLILPRMSDRLQARTLTEVMRHAGAIFEGAGAEIVGGHTTLGAELTIGFTVTGTADHPIGLKGAKPGDALILTRPIGSGTMLAAEMQGRARGRDVAAMLQRMATPQSAEAQVLSQAHAMTDVTGFGLAGHLSEMCKASGTGAELWLEALPIYTGAEDLAQAGVTSSLYASNLGYAPVQNARGPRAILLHDPQTAGGLLAAIDATTVDVALKEIRKTAPEAVQIGIVTDSGELTCR